MASDVYDFSEDSRCLPSKPKAVYGFLRVSADMLFEPRAASSQGYYKFVPVLLLAMGTSL